MKYDASHDFVEVSKYALNRYLSNCISYITESMNTNLIFDDFWGKIEWFSKEIYHLFTRSYGKKGEEGF